MESHMDNQHTRSLNKEWLESLQKKAEKVVAAEASSITVGKAGESPLTEYDADNGVFVRRMPEDEHGIIRVSVGGGDNLPVKGDYCTFRGNAKQAVKLLHKAIQAIEQGF